MACFICGFAKTIEAHLIPRAFALEVTSERGEQHLLVHERATNQKTNTGIYDQSILCGPCDNILGKHEGYAFNLLKQIREEKPPVDKRITVDPIEGDTLVKFAAGICWKYSVTSREKGRISIGPYIDTLAAVAFEQGAIPPSLDLAGFYLHVATHDTYFYRTPFPDRKEGVNVIRFSVGGFVFFLKVDKRPNPSLIPDEYWLRGKSCASFIIAPAENFEEWNLHATLAAEPGPSSFFRRMRDRKRRPP